MTDRAATLEGLLDDVDYRLAAGFEPTAGIAARALAAWFGDDPVRAERAWAEVERLVAGRVDARRALERDWPAVTDCDRLDRAFAALGSDGVLCRPNFGDHDGTLYEDVEEEVAAARAAGRTVDGYAAYTEQDLFDVVHGVAPLWLSYGTVPFDAAAAVAIGGRIVAALRAAGLNVDWDGTIERRIAVALDWRRRLPD